MPLLVILPLIPGMTTLDANRWVLDKMAEYYPLGVIKEVADQ